MPGPTIAKVKKQWKDEEKCFTPFLANNLHLLSKELGFDLELEGMEVKAGPFKADIVARKSNSVDRVIIENQLTLADSKHLGQIIHYHVSLGAQTSVWVAPRFWGTSRSAIRWLNKISGGEFSFFAVRVSVPSDQDTKFHPVLEVFDYPKSWKDRRAIEFWSHSDARLPKGRKGAMGSSCRRRRHFVKEANLKIVQYFQPDCVRVYITGNWGEGDGPVFSRIAPFRASLRAVSSDSEFLGGKNPRCTTQLRIDTHDKGNWNEMAEWLETQRLKYETVLKSRHLSAG
ncbi:MAG: hypothetical protein OXL39_17925 [Caldilineaceae bacterium]|nr:hypothetical protein [Caldilineaceae bacterium]